MLFITYRYANLVKAPQAIATDCVAACIATVLPQSYMINHQEVQAKLTRLLQLHKKGTTFEQAKAALKALYPNVRCTVGKGLSFSEMLRYSVGNHIILGIRPALIYRTSTSLLHAVVLTGAEIPADVPPHLDHLIKWKPALKISDPAPGFPDEMWVNYLRLEEAYDAAGKDCLLITPPKD